MSIKPDGSRGREKRMNHREGAMTKSEAQRVKTKTEEELADYKIFVNILNLEG